MLQNQNRAPFLLFVDGWNRFGCKADVQRIIYLAVLVGLWACCLGSRSFANDGAQEGQTYAPHESKVKVKRILSATTEPKRSFWLKAEVSGRLEQRPLDLGDVVEASTRTLKLESTRQDLRCRLVASQLQGAKHQLEAEGLRLEKMKERSLFLEKELARHKDLLKKGGKTQQQIDTEEQTLLQLKLDMRQQGLLIKNAQEGVEQLKLELELQRDQQSRHVVEAPLGWQVVALGKEVGEWVQAGEPLLKLREASTQVVRFYVSAAEWEVLQKAERSLHYIHRGIQRPYKVLLLEAEAGASRKRQLHLEIQNPPEQSTGEEVRLSLWEEDPSSMLIPKAYVKNSYGQPMVQTSVGHWEPIRVLRDLGHAWVVPRSALVEGTQLWPFVGDDQGSDEQASSSVDGSKKRGEDQ